MRKTSANSTYKKLAASLLLEAVSQGNRQLLVAANR